MMEWNEEKAQEIIKKHKSRFSLRLTLKIVWVLVVVFILFSIYMIVLSISYDSSSIGKRTEFYQKLAIDWTYPELTSDLPVSAFNEITPVLTQKIEFPLMRRLGNKDYAVSQLKLSNSIITGRTLVNLTENYSYLGDQNFWFNLPIHPIDGRKLDGDRQSNAWETLKMIHEGNVADLAFSTEEYHSPQEIIELLSPFDIDILWMPLYMGETQNFTEGGTSSDGNSYSVFPQWGLAGFRKMSDDYMSGSKAHGLDEGTIDESQEAMLENMQAMLKENKRLAEKLLGTQHLQERYDYLNDQGFQAFGAVVTGPVKELLKLKELAGIHKVTLGEITYWNWDGS